ncbi:MFS transporter [Actinoplanes sp. KI2]|uniref:MFS transporter n=1 Tax=Actinoplanes sp. KI2 TaxID=2983315 RepID=UPI0021D59486|nr:MFS transporter [Actinoplanes sp. KI2]MCU7730200.1 MFS transporter [Actinoplanes sp. KI2]
MSAAPAAAARLPASVWAAGSLNFLAGAADNIVLLLVLWAAGPRGWTGSETALVVLALRLPTLLTASVAGRAIDRWGARRVAGADLAVRCVALLLLICAGAATGALPLPAVVAAGALCGATSPASYAAVRWATPRLVGRGRLGQANIVIGLSDQLPLLAAGVLVGPSFELLGPVYAVAVPAALLLPALAVVRRLPAAATAPSPAGPPHGPRRPPRRVLALIALSTAYYLLYGPFETVTPAYVRDRLGGDAGTYGLIWSAFGLGAILSLAAAARLARRRPGRVNAIGAALWGATMLPLPIIGDAGTAAALFLLSGAIWGPYTTIETSALQRWTDPSAHGAVFGLQRGLLATAAPLGAAGGALLAQVVSPPLVLGASAAACGVAGLAALADRGLRNAA